MWPFTKQLKFETAAAETEWLLETISSVDEGRFLVDMMKKKQIPIEAMKSTDLADGKYSEYGIQLKSSLPPRQKAAVLIHELCHMLQEDKAGTLWAREMNVKDRILLSRVIEGDAHARAALITRKINKKTGLKIPVRYKKLIAPLGWRGIKNLFSGKKSSDIEVVDCVFRNYQDNLFTRIIYDDFCAKQSFFKPEQLLSKDFSNLARILNCGDISPGSSYMGGKRLPEMLDYLCSKASKRHIRSNAY